MRSFIRGLFWLSAIFGAIGFLLYLFVFDTWVVPSDDPVFLASLEPTLHAGDRILVQRKTTPRTSQLARCASPENPTRFVVGRVFGGPGDRIEIRGGRVSIAGKMIGIRHGCRPVTIVHPTTERELTLSCGVEDNGAWTYSTLSYGEGVGEGLGGGVVEPGKLFLVSDDRFLHYDTRDYGQVEADSCEHVVFRLWGSSFQDASRRFTILW